MRQARYQEELDKLHHKYSIPNLKIIILDEIDSTNKKAWELISQKTELPLAITALKQTAGKGQWGKTWQSRWGGLYLSLALKCNLLLENNFHLVMSTAVGITQLLRDYQLPVTIKWSNDLILDSRKLGGIKIETKSQENIIKYAVIGVGINWHNNVPKPGINLASYYQKQTRQKINSLEQLTAITTVGILRGYQDYLQQGLDTIHQKYLQLSNSIGRQITLNNGIGKITGITTKGQLQVTLKSSGATSKILLSPGEFSLGYKDCNTSLFFINQESS